MRCAKLSWAAERGRGQPFFDHSLCRTSPVQYRHLAVRVRLPSPSIAPSSRRRRLRAVLGRSHHVARTDEAVEQVGGGSSLQIRPRERWPHGLGRSARASPGGKGRPRAMLGSAPGAQSPSAVVGSRGVSRVTAAGKECCASSSSHREGRVLGGPVHRPLAFRGAPEWPLRALGVEPPQMTIKVAAVTRVRSARVISRNFLDVSSAGALRRGGPDTRPRISLHSSFHPATRRTVRPPALPAVVQSRTPPSASPSTD
jgi:hypothetical protein